MVYGFSNQSIGVSRKNITKKYTFSKAEFNPDKVPPYAYNIKDENGLISFMCSYDTKGEPVYRKDG
ncbi:MAG: hypothetical protein Q4E86_03855 [Lachnospiraceae bacterium]|nr:hypothetical protein [Lachnospiraceae bacterium]